MRVVSSVFSLAYSPVALCMQRTEHSISAFVRADLHSTDVSASSSTADVSETVSLPIRPAAR
jgi:hypothetical protein